jgi:Ca2+/Na+ antiporter
MLENAKRQLNLYALIMFLFIAAFVALITTVDPYVAGKFTIFLAYCCVAGFVFCLSTLVFYAVRPKDHGGLHYQRLSHANREAFFVTLFVIVSLVLGSHGLLYWWIEATLFFALVSFELFFLT